MSDAAPGRVASALLAAGRGRRMGGDKHLLPLEGAPLLVHALRALAAAEVAPPVLILRAGDRRGFALAAELDVRAVPAEASDEGRAASVRAAVRAAAPDSEALLIALADQPWLEASDFDRLVHTWRAAAADAIVHATYAGQRGSPVLFGRHWFPELLELSGAEGGRSLLQRHPEVAVPVALDAERGRDLDRPEDWPEARERR